MSLNDCIDQGVVAGLIDEARANEAKALHDDFYEQYRLELGDTEALAKARKDTISAVERQLRQQKREKLLQATRTRDILENVQRAARDGVDIDRAMLAHLDFDPGVKGIASLSKRHDAIRGVLHEDLDGFLQKFRRNLIGENRNKAELQDILQELFEVDSGNASAKEFSQAWTSTANKARQMFNKAGGDIPELKGWRLPQQHDFVKIRQAGFDEWFDFIRPRLDAEKMINYSTGKPHTEASLVSAARDAFDEISSEGWAGREITSNAYGRKLSQTRQDHRYFVFKSAEDWTAYHTRFGSGDMFSIMMGHLDNMSRDISQLQILGPNPQATIRWMGDVVQQDLNTRAANSGTGTRTLSDRGTRFASRAQNMFDHFTGAMNAPVNGKVATTLSATRQLLTAAQLGSAALSAVTDLGFGKLASGQVGVEYRKVLGRQLSLLNPKNVEDQKLAVRLGLIAEEWSTMASAQQRYVGEISGTETTQRIADAVMRASGLSPWTQAGRWAFGMEFAGAMADYAGKRLGELPEPLKQTFERYGITSQDWDTARQTGIYEQNGATFLRPQDIEAEDIAYKFRDMLHTETEFAIPSSSLRGRSLLVGSTQPGTVQGELARSFAMYKNFSITLMMTHFRRALAMPSKGQAAQYAAQMILSTTLLGGLSIQLKELSKGRDPRDMTTPQFWGAATLQGGGLGPFGDFLFASKNRHDKGFTATVAGPVVGLGADIIGTVNQNVTRAAEGEDTKVGSDLIDFAQRYAPGGSLWYLRTAMQDLVFDNLRHLADPKAAQRLRRIERRYRKEYGQDHFVSRTSNKVRLPDLTAVFGQ